MSSDPRFTPTSWTIVAQAGDRESPDYQQAMQTLCQRYWYPLYAYCRRAFSKSPQEAEDLTQAFFARLIEKEIVAEADVDRGKFRTFLLVCFKRFLLNDVKKPQLRPLSINQQQAEQRIQLEPADSAASPEERFQRDWALQVLRLALDTLRESYEMRGRLAWYEKLSPYLQARPAAGVYAEVAAELNASADAVKNEVSRMRQRYQETIRHQIADTLDEKSSLEDELLDLFAALRN